MNFSAAYARSLAFAARVNVKVLHPSAYVRGQPSQVHDTLQCLYRSVSTIFERRREIAVAPHDL